jgi:simple sugar transport system permease protein
MSLGERLRRHPGVAALAALLLLLAFNAAFTPNFARLEVRDGRLYGALVDVLHNGAPVLLLSIGMTLVIALGGIDLSVGSVMALAGTVAALLLTEGHSAMVAVLAGLAVAAAAGAWNGVLLSYLGLQPIVATLILLVAGRGLAQTLSNDQKVRFTHSNFEFLGNGSALGLPIPVYLAAGLALLTLLLLRRTALGLYIEAIGTNPRAARLCGLRINAIRVAGYAFSGLCAGLAGLIVTADIREADVANAGLYTELDAILAVVIGGTSLTGGRPRLLGALVGALIMQTLTVTLQMRGVVTEYTLIVKAAVAIAVCWLQTPVFGRLLAGPMRGKAAA